MKQKLLIIVTYNIMLLYRIVMTDTYLDSEDNLMDILDNYIKLQEIYLNKTKSYLSALQQSYIRNKCTESNGNGLESSLKKYMVTKRIVVDWKNFANFLFNETKITELIKDSIYEARYSDWTLDINDIKLILFVRSLSTIPKISKLQQLETNKTQDYLNLYFPMRNFHNLTDATKRLLHFKLNNFRTDFENWQTKLKASILSKITMFRNSLREFINETKYIDPMFHPYWPTYTSLCRGDVLKNENTANLKCRYVHFNKAYLLIGPFKLEEVYPDPQIVMFHDVLYDNEITKIKEIAIKNKMTISQNKETSYRVAKVTWMALEAIPQVFKRLEYMTNLDLKFAEAFQIAVYGLAGHYDPHYDSGLDKSDPTSARISTVLFYLNDVKKGGATVFPRLNLAVWPKKGSATFWYNIRPSHDVDQRTLHAGCPLYSGTKWVMNLWVTHDGQEFRKPCNVKHPTSFVF